MLFRTPAFMAASLSLSMRQLSSYFTGRIDNDEKVIFFPTIGKEFNDSHWEVPVHGWIYEPELNSTKRRAFKSLLANSLNITCATERPILDRRIQKFLVDNQRLKSPRIRFLGSDHIHRMPRSSKNGHFRTVLHLPKEEATISNDDKNQFLHYEAVAGDGRIFPGTVHLLSNDKNGVSVISDIDDTIKISNVTNTKSLLRNTFLEEFKPVPGMAKLYRKWKKERGATFHFVSSSPFQLYEELENFRKDANFPDATYNLKTIRPKDKTFFNLFADPFKTKTTEIVSIMERFPLRKFVLVGDSGEKDPEVYGHIARTYPDQVLAIYIRKVDGKKKKTEEKDEEGDTVMTFEDRMENAFLDIPTEKWELFHDASTVGELPLNIIESVSVN